MTELGQHVTASPQLKPTDVKPQDDGFSPSQVWNSWIGRRVTLMVFSIVFLIQVIVCIFMINVYKNEQLGGLREVARTALAQTMHDSTTGQPVAPLQQAEIDKLLAQTVIQGLAVYGMDYSLVKTYGAPPTLELSVEKRNPGDYRSPDGLHFEVTFTSNEIGHPYNVTARLDSSEVAHHVSAHTRQTLQIFFALSIFVTVTLMLAMNQLLLAPVLRRNDSLVKKMHTEVEDRIRRIAYYDTLTGLPNRTFFLENLEESIKNKTHGKDNALAVFFIDLDHFKDINDAMGHDMGDKLLSVIAQRLVEALPKIAVVSRTGADEFAIMAPLPPESTDSSLLAETILTCLQEPVEIMRRCCALSA